MLAELQIADFAIIDRLRMPLAPGFNVLTGETGAGKSIIVDAVQALTGGRIGVEVVRSGAAVARVEGVFERAGDQYSERVQAACAEYGIDLDEGLILTREIQAAGRTVCRINGRVVPQSVLRAIGELLVDIHGQSEHLSLLRTADQLDLLDRFGGLMDQRAEVATLVRAVREVRATIDQLQRDDRELARRVDLLRFQVEEIAAAQLRPGEDAELEDERNLLANSERLTQLAGSAYDAITGDRETGVVDQLGLAVAALRDLAKIDPSRTALADQVETALYQCEDAARTIRDYRDSIEYQPDRLEAIAERLDLIKNLKRKYGQSIQEVLAFGERAARELDSITHAEERLAELQAEEGSLLRRIGRHGLDLSQARQQAAEQLAGAIERELNDLNMRGARFAVQLRQPPDDNGAILPEADQRVAFDETGIDRIEFLIAPNPGEPPKPLAKIASGGETARLMLAMKSVLQRADETGTLIFDEIDVGIGGRSGLTVGEKLWQLGSSHQVLCVTHLPQTASYADVHVVVEKQVVEGRTVTRLRPLSDEQRAAALAEMMGGAVTDATMRSGHDLLERAHARKAELHGGNGHQGTLLPVDGAKRRKAKTS